MPGQLFLQSHVFLCRGKRHWVILDVNRDKYLCVDRRQFEALGPLLQGWASDTGDIRDAKGPSGHGGTDSSRAYSEPDASKPQEDVVDLANQLLSLGMLSEAGAHAKGALATAYPLPTEAIDPHEPASSRWSSCVHAGAFFLSCARASRELREQPFRATIESVRERRSRNRVRAGKLDLARARALVATFESLRLFYPRPYLCMFDSLALIHFLARQGLYPDWVFGVNADPFEAHCWVQSGGTVLNDRVERVSGFTPIMCV